MAKAIGTLGAVQTLQVGGMNFIYDTTLIVLGGLTIAAGNYTTMRKPGASAGYAVTAGKTYTVQGFKFWSNTAVNNVYAAALASTTTDVGLNSVAQGSGPNYYIGGSATTGVIGDFNSYVEARNHEYNPFFPVAATTYLTCSSPSAAAGFQSFGYEA